MRTGGALTEILVDGFAGRIEGWSVGSGNLRAAFGVDAALIQLHQICAEAQLVDDAGDNPALQLVSSGQQFPVAPSANRGLRT